MSFTPNETYKMTVNAVTRKQTGSAFDTTAPCDRMRPGGHTMAKPLGTKANAFSGRRTTSHADTRRTARVCVAAVVRVLTLTRSTRIVQITSRRVLETAAQSQSVRVRQWNRSALPKKRR